MKFKNAIHSSRLEGCTVKGITIKAYVRVLSERNPIVLGETKQMLDWTRFSTTFGVSRYIKVPIWNNDKITGHLSLSYEFSRTSIVQNCEDDFSEKHIDITYNLNEKEIENPKGQQCEPANIPKSIVTITKKEESNYNISSPYRLTNETYLYSKLYPDRNHYDNIFESKLFLDEDPKNEIKKITKEKEVQTNDIRKHSKSIQTVIKTFNVAVQVECDELDDPLDKTIYCDVQNIFRCTHEFTFNIEKSCNSIFNYVTYQFPECVTNSTGKGKIYK